MRLLNCLLALLLLVNITFAQQSAPPVLFDKQPFVYFLLRHIVFDLDKILIEIGLQVKACRLDSEVLLRNHEGAGACLYEAIHHTIKFKRSSVIVLWVTDEKGNVLPPLKIEWTHSHSSFFKFANEFLFMSFENLFKGSVKAEHNVSSVSETGKCTLLKEQNRDLGNFIGNMIIHVPPGRRIAEYLKFGILKDVDTQKLVLSAQVPVYLDKKRVYQAKFNYQNPQAETMEISIATNFNLVSQRDFCIKGNLSFVPRPTVATP